MASVFAIHSVGSSDLSHLQKRLAGDTARAPPLGVQAASNGEVSSSAATTTQLSALISIPSR